MKANLKAEDKRLVAVLMSTNGKISEEAIEEAKSRIRSRGMSTQSVSTTENGFSTVLVFEIYEGSALLKQRIGYRLRKLLTTAMMKVNGGKIIVKVAIEDETGRFPMHGAFH